jgi:FixJ family two-component response regulator
MTASITVSVVDQDETLRQAMSRLVRADGFGAECFESTDASPKERDWPGGVVVLIVELATALRSDKLFYRQSNIRDLHPPVICLTSCDTDRMRRVEAHPERLAGQAGLFANRQRAGWQG